MELSEETFERYALQHYDNAGCSGKQEFLDDLKRFKYLKRLFRQHGTGRDLRERLILNHIIVIYNLFGTEAATRMLFYRIDRTYWSQLKTFLVFLNYMPLRIIVSPGTEINDSDLAIDENIANILRKI